MSLPFEDACSDPVYSADMIYHIHDMSSQTVVMSKMIRMLRTGGRLILVTANPRPVLFPVRLITRVVADMLVFPKLARQIKGKSPMLNKPAKLSRHRARRDGVGD